LLPVPPGSSCYRSRNDDSLSLACASASSFFSAVTT
jgi:hypothetical protein